MKSQRENGKCESSAKGIAFIKSESLKKKNETMEQN